ncbi:hypothetical protein PAPYR_7340 [Paratrimastix pyriformis]|uniref:IPT/TIG domain-containing protein n=1 Tax=Paratrimastix pyriformis TaxID=342808 RepID=A0ABQ8UHT3_9EUKA|nr:hypothetical protein PAPYR_7340 [Paratrimastix pyriformis]
MPLSEVLAIVLGLLSLADGHLLQVSCKEEAIILVPGHVSEFIPMGAGISFNLTPEELLNTKFIVNSTSPDCTLRCSDHACSSCPTSSESDVPRVLPKGWGKTSTLRLVELSANAASATVPVLESVRPTSAPAKGKTTLTLCGTHFQAGIAVLVGQSPCVVQSGLTDTQFTCVVDGGAPGSAVVNVTNPDGGAASLSWAFVFQYPKEDLLVAVLVPVLSVFGLLMLLLAANLVGIRIHAKWLRREALKRAAAAPKAEPAPSAAVTAATELAPPPPMPAPGSLSIGSAAAVACPPPVTLSYVVLPSVPYWLSFDQLATMTGGARSYSSPAIMSPAPPGAPPLASNNDTPQMASVPVTAAPVAPQPQSAIARSSSVPRAMCSPHLGRVFTPRPGAVSRQGRASPEPAVAAAAQSQPAPSTTAEAAGAVAALAVPLPHPEKESASAGPCAHFESRHLTEPPIRPAELPPPIHTPLAA